MPTHKLSWCGEVFAIKESATALTEILWPPAEAVSCFQDEEDTRLWRLEAYFSKLPDPSSWNAVLSQIDGIENTLEESLPDRDWVAHSLAGLGVVRAGRFILYGVHDADKLPENKSLISNPALPKAIRITPAKKTRISRSRILPGWPAGSRS